MNSTVLSTKKLSVEGVVIETGPALPKDPEPRHLPTLLDHLLDLGPIHRPLELVLQCADRRRFGDHANKGLLQDVVVSPILLQNVRNGLSLGNSKISERSCGSLEVRGLTLTGTSHCMTK